MFRCVTRLGSQHNEGMSTCSTFIHTSEALPAWLTAQSFGGICQFGPVDMPVAGPRQLTIDDAMRHGLNGRAARNGEAPLDPAVDGGTGNAEKSGNGCLPSSDYESGVNIGAHADIVQIGYANGQHGAALPLIKSANMDVWKNIEDELHRRRLNAAWLGKKLGASRQVISGWKTRGVPTARYEEIAELLGWSLDRLVNPVESLPPTPQAAAHSSGYSPMALDIARRLDDIADDRQRSRAYALFLQIATLSAAPAPMPVDRGQAEPVAQPMTSRRHAM